MACGTPSQKSSIWNLDDFPFLQFFHGCIKVLRPIQISPFPIIVRLIHQVKGISTGRLQLPEALTDLTSWNPSENRLPAIVIRVEQIFVVQGISDRVVFLVNWL
jgi:hypothetical protein